MTPAVALRRAATLALCAVAVLALDAGWTTTPADATSYRFWSYWSGGSDWTFASQGASRRPADGAVEGWRFAVSEASTSTTPPRHSPRFSRICGDTDPAEGSKRVGLVIDSGIADDAPAGESPPPLTASCVVVPADANGYQVLAAAGVQLRTDSGLICGLNGYPATECGEPVADPEPTDDGGSGSGAGGSGGHRADDDGSPSDGGSSADPTPDDNGEAKGDGHAGKKSEEPQDRRDSEKADRLPAPRDSAAALAGAAPAAAPTAATTDTGSPVGLLVGLVAVAALGVAAWVLRRRRA